MPAKGKTSNNPNGRPKTGQRKQYVGIYLTPQEIMQKTGISDVVQAKARLRDMIAAYVSSVTNK